MDDQPDSTGRRPPARGGAARARLAGLGPDYVRRAVRDDRTAAREGWPLTFTFANGKVTRVEVVGGSALREVDITVLQPPLHRKTSSPTRR